MLSRIYAAEISLTETHQKTTPTEKEELKIFQEMHMKPASGHLDMNNTYASMKLFITWPGMTQEIEN